MIKLFHNDKYLGSFKTGKRQFQSNQYKKKYTFKQKVSLFFQTVATYSFLALIVVIIFKLGGIANPITKVEARDVLVDNLNAKVESLKEEVVNAIRACESAGNKENDGLITFDPHKTNTKVQPASIGTLQFKIATVQHYYKTIYGKTITPKEAVLIALDDEKSGKLAYDIIFKSGSGTKDWHTCGNSKKVQDTLLVIKKLQ